MPSSTSNFERAIPDRSWWRWLGCAALLTALAVLACETLLRAHGYGPSVLDDQDLWAVERRNCSRDSQRIALLGNSQVQVAVAPARLAGALPGYRVHQLAVEGSSPVPALLDLAADRHFRGLAVCTMGPLDVLPLLQKEQARFVRYYRRDFTLDDVVNRRIATFLQLRLTVLDPYVSLKRLVQEAVSVHRWPAPRPVVTAADRSRQVDFTLINVQAKREAGLRDFRALCAQAKDWTREAWLAEARKLAEAARAVEERGGHVLFIRLPLLGEAWAVEEETFPRRDYWDAWVQSTGVDALHFRDRPELQAFDLPDGVHIDTKDIDRFTDLMASELRSRLPAAPGKGPL